ncbi:MAG: Lon protease-like protein [Candidatus Azotimanducaceae bacterium]|jgi:Lon protease-like protein
MIKVAVFPIPNSVNFPGVPCSLHVFEPRYRRMVKHCIDNELSMGVCHTAKVLRESEQHQSIETALNSNQSTYKPVEIFSAGPVTLLEELEDGRMVIEVDIDTRVKLKTELQTLPFNIWACDELPDEALTDAEEHNLIQTQQKILKRLLVITYANQKNQQLLQSEFWQNMPAGDFSFAVIGLLGLPGEIQQEMLEMTKPTDRLQRALSILNENP